MATNANATNVVSTGDLTVNKVVTALQSRTTFSLFRQNLSSINLALDGDMDLYSTLNQDLTVFRTKDLSQVVYTLILSWVSKKKGKATLDVLIKALEANGMNDCAESLEELKVEGSINQVIANLPDVPDGPLPAAPAENELQQRLDNLRE